MRHSLTLVTAPTSEPVTLGEVKAWARLDTGDEDPTLDALIATARGAAEEYLRRSLITQSWKLTLGLEQSPDYYNLPAGVYDLPVSALFAGLPRSIHLPKGQIQSITSVTTYDTTNTGTVYSSSNYYLDAAGERVVLNTDAVWPSPLRPAAACEIVYAAGYGDTASSVPQPVRTAILMHVAAMYETRGQCEQPDMPPAVEQILKKYRIMGDRRG
ncbi:MAG: phage head-tail connector protein [Planctomycetes bacterium]|nr:phage head-tail connector protein [Planctomycetota bacterium]